MHSQYVYSMQAIKNNIKSKYVARYIAIIILLENKITPKILMLRLCTYIAIRAYIHTYIAIITVHA